jgi:hypothetical protein
MTRRLTSVIFIATFSLTSFAQNAGDIGLLKKLNVQLIAWFNELSGSVNQLADKEDQQRLKKSFIKLKSSLYEVETNGRNLVITLERTPLDKSKAKTAVSDTRKALTDLQTQLHTTGLALRAQYRQGGADAEQMIANA